jgi:hypothetical protein
MVPVDGLSGLGDGLAMAWDRVWLVLVMGLGLVMAFVLHRSHPPEEK